MPGIQERLDRLTPEKALKEMEAALKKTLSLVSEETRLDFIVQLLGDAGDDKVASMVHL